ncbi:MAG TPA: biotin/lipoyl-binding protein [Candidatus Hydrogenedens sp.]|nr:biotin/lipoyl-binding protein [Candidatus Hydrogenedens sp.]HOL18626.1 biotin/lipoyl-binding protein [Candidatus Hydrogenedens sp.]HPP57528.1 biotin/lipoyl-binding protein [Candidatus Hydrogenedens sp.]
MNDDEIKKYITISKLVSFLIAILIFLLGIVSFLFFSSFRKPPAQAEQEERPIPVDVVQVQPEDVPIILNGFGEVRTLATVPIAPEVSGRVIHIHPRLEAGEVIPVGEVLFEIDPSDYQVRLKSAQASLEQAKQTLKRTQEQFASDKERLKTLERTKDLAYSEFQRVKQLFEREKVGTQSNVEQTERAYNQALDAYNLLVQSVELYPLRVRESEEVVKNAEAQLSQAEINLSRTQVKVPFNARIKTVNLEAGQYVTPGSVVMTLSDDSILEISVPLDAKQATQWLPFQKDNINIDSAWFPPLEPKECEILWTEDKENHKWKGLLHRIERYDEKTRTIYAVVRIEKENVFSLSDDKIPLVQGMFCQVKIPGKILSGVFRLPDTAVSFEGTVYVAENDRLKSVQVERLYIQGDEVIVKGLKPGTVVVTTRLVNPIENSLLEIQKSGDKESDS